MDRKNNLYDLVQLCRKHDDEASMEMLEIFNPLIKRYARLLDYEDAKYDLIEQFYRCIYKIPIDNYKFKEEKYIKHNSCLYKIRENKK